MFRCAGLALATKHSAPVFCIILAIAGIILLIFISRQGPSDTRFYRFAKLAAVFLGAFIILWGFYRFRFTESATSAETFNRPLALKIADLRSPTNRFIIAHLNSAHLLPRAYIWGLADTVRGGVEGRLESRLCFGKPVLKAPFYFFPGVVAVKLPIGLGILVLLGLVLFFSRRLPREWDIPAVLLLFAATAISSSWLTVPATRGCGTRCPPWCCFPHLGDSRFIWPSSRKTDGSEASSRLPFSLLLHPPYL